MRLFDPSLIWTPLPHRFKSSLNDFIFEETLHIFFPYEHYAVVSYFFLIAVLKTVPPPFSLNYPNNKIITIASEAPSPCILYMYGNLRQQIRSLKTIIDLGYKPIFLFLCPELISKVYPAQPSRARPNHDSLWRLIFQTVL